MTENFFAFLQEKPSEQIYTIGEEHPTILFLPKGVGRGWAGEETR